MISGRLTLLTVCLAMAIAGCKITSAKDARYETIQADPRHDTETAQRENAKAVAYLQKQQFAKAEKALERALVADVNYGPAHNNLGQLYYDQKKFYLAALEFEYASTLMPDRPEPYNNLGLVHEAVAKLTQAIQYYETAVGLNPEDPQYLANLIRGRIRLGQIGPETAQLLQELARRDDRPEWREWARQQLATADSTAVSQTPTDSSEIDLQHLPIPYSTDISGDAVIPAPTGQQEQSDWQPAQKQSR